MISSSLRFHLTESCLHQDLRALVLLLSVQPPQAAEPALCPALCPALQELLVRCRLCIQQRNALELEAKDHKSKGTKPGLSQNQRLLTFWF